MRDPIADLSGYPGCSTYMSPQLVPTPPVVKIEKLVEKLRPEQVGVLAHLCGGGQSIADAAELEQVHRGTVHRWLKDDPDFRAAFNAWKEETILSGRARVARMVGPALDTLLSCVMKGQFQAAVTVLKTMGILDKQQPGTIDRDLLDKEIQIERRRQRADMEKRAIEMFVDETSCFPNVADQAMQEIFKLTDKDKKQENEEGGEEVEENEELDEEEEEEEEVDDTECAADESRDGKGVDQAVRPPTARVRVPEVSTEAEVPAGVASQLEPVAREA